MSEGVVYIATGEEYCNQAANSARTVKNHNTTDVALICSEADADLFEDTDIFDHIILIDDPFYDLRDKAYYLDKSPYDKTIYVDSDVVILGDITPMFSLLERVDLALAYTRYRPLVSINGIPDCFTEPNGGVLAFDQRHINGFFDNWVGFYEDQIENGREDDTVRIPGADSMKEASSFGRYHDQPPLREALFHTDVDYHILPPEYNYKGHGAYASDKIKIFHYGDMDPSLSSKFSAVLNESSGPRVLWGYKFLVRDGPSYNFESIITDRILDKLIQIFPIGKFLEAIRMKKYAKRLYNTLR